MRHRADPEPAPAVATQVATPLDETLAGRVRINLQWLLKLRWAAVFGQLVTVSLLHYVFGVTLPVNPLLVIIGLTAASNVIFAIWAVRRLRGAAPDLSSERGEWLEGSFMVADIILLTALLFFTGGPENPFFVFYFVHVVLAAVLLRSRWTYALTAIAIACYAFLFLAHVPLPALADRALRLEGFLVAFVAAATIAAYFVVRITAELEKREADLHLIRHRKASSERVAALVTLAAGAAHELSTPLSTIAVVARELERELESVRGVVSSDAIDDVNLIRQEVTRCRSILEQMSASSGEVVGEKMEWVRVGDLIDGTLEPLHAGDRIDRDCSESTADLRAFVPASALKRAVRGLVKNALDASPPEGRVRLSIAEEGDFVRVDVVDEGTGMSRELIERAWDPFFTTKDPGKGMGLGLYLARSVLERLGGGLHLRSEPGRGTHAIARIPLRPRFEHPEIRVAETNPLAGGRT